MSKPAPWARAWLCVLTLLAWLGILLQLWIAGTAAARRGEPFWHGVGLALCYFTVLTNIWVALVSTRLASGGGGLLSAPGTLAASAVYIAVVGLIYSLLLRQLWAPVGLHRLADQILHYVTPLLFVSWWLVCAPKSGLRFADALKWLLYPLAYFAFSLLLGAASGRYLYPFADTGAHGLATVLRNGVLLLGLFLGLGVVAVAAGRLRAR